jgi:hypothetical protein
VSPMRSLALARSVFSNGSHGWSMFECSSWRPSRRGSGLRAKANTRGPRHSSDQLFHPHAHRTPYIFRHTPIRYPRDPLLYLAYYPPPPTTPSRPIAPRHSHHVRQDAARTAARRLQIRPVQARAVGYAHALPLLYGHD